MGTCLGTCPFFLPARRACEKALPAGQEGLLQERLGFDPEVIEAQLAHAVRDNLGRAHNRTEFIEQRHKMLQTWADYLDKLRPRVLH